MTQACAFSSPKTGSVSGDLSPTGPNTTSKVDEKRLRGILLVCVAERDRTCVTLTETPGRCGTPSPARYRSPYGLTITGRLSSYASRGECSIARWSHLLEVGPNLLLARSP